MIETNEMSRPTLKSMALLAAIGGLALRLQAQVNQYQLPFSIRETISDAVAWIKVHLPGSRSYSRSGTTAQELFYSVAYERYQPGLSEEAIAGLTPEEKTSATD
jgi:hypothetical protein